MGEYITPLNILYAIVVLLFLSCIAEITYYCSTTLKIRRWKPDMYKMHYTIRTATENCIPHFNYNEESDIHTVEYRELLTGRQILTQVITPEEHLKMANAESINIEVSTLRIYIITPNLHVVYKDFTRTDRDPKYRPFREKDISTNIILLAAEHFKRRCPIKKNKSQKRDSDINYVRSLPYAVKRRDAR